MLTLLPVLIAAVVGPAPPPPFSLVPPDLAALTDAEAPQLAGRRALYCVVIEGEPDGDPEHGWRYECRGEGPSLRTVWLRDGDDLAAEVALQGSGGLLVEATLRRIVQPAVRVNDGSRLPALLEDRLVGARVVGPREK